MELDIFFVLIVFAKVFYCLQSGLLQDKIKLLRSWVKCGENSRTEREPWSVRDMLQANLPIEKIRSIISRGGATPDPDCPEVEECFQYWVITKRRRTSSEVVTQCGDHARECRRALECFLYACFQCCCACSQACGWIEPCRYCVPGAASFVSAYVYHSAYFRFK